MYKIRDNVDLKELLDNYENAIYGQASPITPSIHQLHLLLDYIANLEQQCKKQKEVIDKAIELLGNYKHYSTPDEKQNSDNEDLVNNAFDILKEVSK